MATNGNSLQVFSGPFGARRVVAPVIFALAFFIVWEVWLRFLPMSRAVIAPPSAIYTTIVNAFPILMKHTLSTLVEIMIGFMSASAVGIALGAAITLSTSIRQAFYPNIVGFQLIPKVAVAPLLRLIVFALTPCGPRGTCAATHEVESAIRIKIAVDFLSFIFILRYLRRNKMAKTIIVLV